MTRHILQDETYLEIHPGDQAAVTQGDQIIILPIEKWLEVYLRLVNLKRPAGLEVPPLPLKYPEGKE